MNNIKVFIFKAGYFFIAHVAFVLAVFVFYPGCTSDKKNLTGIIASKSGLTLREKPAKNSKKIDALKSGTVVAILSEGPKEVINGINAHWQFVQFNNIKGWVFGGYLIRIKKFSVEGRTFSKGSGCDPSSYSEFSHTLEFQENLQIKNFYNGAYALGEKCFGVLSEIKKGKYIQSKKGHSIEIQYNKKISELSIEDPDCENQTYIRKKETSEKTKLYTASCRNDKGQALDMLYEAKKNSWWVLYDE